MDVDVQQQEPELLYAFLIWLEKVNLRDWGSTQAREARQNNPGQLEQLYQGGRKQLTYYKAAVGWLFRLLLRQNKR